MKHPTSTCSFDCLDIPLCFWQKIQNFGEPFLLAVHEDETLALVKIRVQKKLHAPDEDFSKVVFLGPKFINYFKRLQQTAF